MSVEEIGPCLVGGEVPGTGDSPEAAGSATDAVKGLIHVPLGTGVEESDNVTLGDADGLAVLVAARGHTDLNDGLVGVGQDMELDAGVAAVVHVQPVAIELHVQSLGDLHTGPSFVFGHGQRRRGQSCHECPRWEGCCRDRVRCKRSGLANDFDHVGVSGCVAHGCYRLFECPERKKMLVSSWLQGEETWELVGAAKANRQSDVDSDKEEIELLQKVMSLKGKP